MITIWAGGKQFSTAFETSKMNKQKRKNKQRPRRRAAQQPRRPRPQKQIVVDRSIVPVSPCTLAYAMALTDPFRLQEPACVIDQHSIPTKKIKTLTRGTLNVGTAGMGYMLVNPFYGSSSTQAVGTETYGMVAWSGTTYGGTTLAESSTVTGVDVAGVGQFPYGPLDYEWNWTTGNRNRSGISLRPVGVGIRIRYTGTELNRSGRIIMCRHPDQGDLGGKSATDLLNYQTVPSVPVGRSWHTLCYRPCSSSDFEFSGNPYLGSELQHTPITTVPLYDNYVVNSMAILIDGAVAGNAFEWEIVGHYEVAGVTDNVSKSHSDIVSLGAIRNQTAGNVPTTSPAKNYTDLAHAVIKAANPHIKTITRHVANAALGAATGGTLKVEHFGLKRNNP